MIAASLSDWAAAVCAAVSLGAITAIPYRLWVDADYWLVDDWQAVGDRLLVEATRARHTARDIQRRLAVTAAALLLILTAAPEATR